MTNPVQTLNASAHDAAQDQSRRAPPGDDDGVFDAVLDQVRGSKGASANKSEPPGGSSAAPLSATGIPLPQGPEENASPFRTAKDPQLAFLMTKGSWTHTARDAQVNEHPDGPQADSALMAGISASVLPAGGPAPAFASVLPQLDQTIAGASQHVASRLAQPGSALQEAVVDPEIPAISVLKAETHFRPVVEGFTVRLNNVANALAPPFATGGLEAIPGVSEPGPPATTRQAMASAMLSPQPADGAGQATSLMDDTREATGVYDADPDVSFAAEDSASLMLDALDRPATAPAGPQISPMMKAIAGFIAQETGVDTTSVKPAFGEILSPT